MKITETIGIVITDDNNNETIVEDFEKESTVTYASKQIINVPIGATDQVVLLPTSVVTVIHMTADNPLKLKLTMGAVVVSPITVSSMFTINTAGVTAISVTNPNSVAVKLSILLG